MFLSEEFVHYLYTVGCISESLKLFVQEVETLPAQYYAYTNRKVKVMRSIFAMAEVPTTLVQ